jgi:GAF domain-containing protein
MEYQRHPQRQLEIFYEIIHSINAGMSQKEALATMLRRIVTDLGYKAATLRLLDEEKRILELGACFGVSEAYLAKGSVEPSKSVIDREALAGKIVAIADVVQESGFQYSGAAKKEGLASLLAVPLIAQGIAIGVLHVYTGEKRSFAPEEQSFITGIASLGAQAIRRTRYFEAFHRLAHNINSSLDVETVLKTLLSQSVKELNVRAGSIRLLGPKKERLHLATSFGLSEEYLKKGEIQLAHSPVDQRVMKEACAVVIEDLAKEAGFQYMEEAQKEGIRSVLVVPLRLRDATIGVMRLYSGQAKRFSHEEISLSDAVADLGAIAIENARLHQLMKAKLEALKEDADGWYRFLSLG